MAIDIMHTLWERYFASVFKMLKHLLNKAGRKQLQYSYMTHRYEYVLHVKV